MPSSSPSRTQRTLSVPCAFDRWILIQAEWPLTQVEWGQMIDVLLAMKPGLVADPPSPGWLDTLAGPLSPFAVSS